MTTRVLVRPVGLETAEVSGSRLAIPTIKAACPLTLSEAEPWSIRVPVTGSRPLWSVSTPQQ